VKVIVVPLFSLVEVERSSCPPSSSLAESSYLGNGFIFCFNEVKAVSTIPGAGRNVSYLLIQISLSNFSSTDLQMLKPRPHPLGLRCLPCSRQVKGTNSKSFCASEIPIPESVTLTTNQVPIVCQLSLFLICESINTVITPFEVNLLALLKRFMNT
jgi:hypothetical protein